MVINGYLIEYQAIADPDYASLLQEAELGAARTDSEQSKLLAHLVTDRLQYCIKGDKFIYIFTVIELADAINA